MDMDAQTIRIRMDINAQKRKNDLGNLLNFAINPTYRVWPVINPTYRVWPVINPTYRVWPVPPNRSEQDSPIHSLDSVIVVEEVFKLTSLFIAYNIIN